MDFVANIPIYKRSEKALTLLKALGIEKHANKYPAIMSGGEQQRCAIARACANDPNIIVADEPTGNLDSHNSELIFNYFKELNNQGKTIIAVTHDKDLAGYANSQILLKDGCIE